MREPNDAGQAPVSGGSLGYGQAPDFDLEGPRGPNCTRSFGNGWSLSVESTLDGSSRGIEVRYVRK